MAISELVKEALFVLQTLEDVHIEVELPVKTFVDNMGAINVVRNNAACNGNGTTHLNVRHHLESEHMLAMITLSSNSNH